jgi:RNase P subunit RPR2
MSDHLDYTNWTCERCGNAGRIQYRVGAGVYEVLHILEDAHNEADTKHACKGDVAKIRVSPGSPAAKSAPHAHRT